MITTTTSTYIEPLHEVRDADKLAELVASMEADGWTGTPVVVAGLGGGVVRALTGSHRLQAAQDAGIDEVPVVSIEDLCAESGIDWDELLDEFGSDLFETGRYVCGELPRSVTEAYGLDLH